MADMQVIIFGIADERYGVRVQQVQSIERLLPITRVPKTLPFIRGVMNLRGVITPVLDVRERFGFATQEATDETRVIVVKVEEILVGLIVDAVMDVATIDEATVEAPPAVVGGVQAEYLHGIARVAEDALILLNLAKILSDVEEKQLLEVEKSVRG